MTFFSDDNGHEAPWPSLSEPVLADGERWTSTHFDAISADDRSAVADGFWHAADRLAGDWLADETRRPYSGVAAAMSFPLLFLYRHALEGTMKAMLAEYAHQTDAQIAAYGHDLSKLWFECRELLWPYDDVPGDDFLAVERAVLAFHDLDPRNDAFRYSHDRKGNPIARTRDGVDVSVLRRGMRGVANYFDCADSELHRQRYGF